jgi:hypothetical protein
MKQHKSMKHICNLCKAEFETDAEYVAHTCEATGVTPADNEHQGPEFAAISEAALKRGAEKKDKAKK